MSNFIVSARKYRPQRFEDVVGQQHVAGTLKNALATDHVAHAFLFTGPRGVGKTTCARILAKILNCENRTKDNEACNTCSSCKSFNENASFNIIELDAASNNSVEHIRALIEQVRFQPQQGKYKVFIIDEVHMLSNQAFNAFLKTLEEPPPYAIFILATTEKHKIIPTILSRCQIFDFRRITVGDMVLHLRSICAKEGLSAEEDALHIVAQKADGALRDALSIFDRISSAATDGKITYDSVIENLNVLDYDYYFQLTDGLLAEDLPAILLLFDQIQRKGFEPDVFVNGLAEHLRNILVCKDPATLALLEVGDSLRERYRKQAAIAPASFLLTALNLCNDCDINFKMARHKRLHVELALIKMCYIGRAVKAGHLESAVAAPEKKTPDGRVDAGIRPTSGANPTTAPPVYTGNGQTPPPTNRQLSIAEPAAPEPPPAGGAAIPLSVPANEAAGGALPESNAQLLNKRDMRKLGVDLTKIALSLDAYETAVLEEENAKAGLESRLTLENAHAEWHVFAGRIESNLVRMALTGTTLRLEGKILKAVVRSNIERSHLQSESMRLLDHLRLRLHDQEVTIQIEVDETKADTIKINAPKRPLSAKEKLDNMKMENPLVDDLLKRFDLRLED